jgi:hypothetical protein
MIEVEVKLGPKIGRQAHLGVEHPFGAHGLILILLCVTRFAFILQGTLSEERASL